jgi:hypothetical protein
VCNCLRFVGRGVLKNLGTEYNRTAGSRMVLTNRQDEVQNTAETRTGGSWVLYQSVAGGGLLFESEKLTSLLCCSDD